MLTQRVCLHAYGPMIFLFFCSAVFAGTPNEDMAASQPTPVEPDPPPEVPDFGGEYDADDCTCLDLVFLVDITQSMSLSQSIEEDLMAVVDCAAAGAGADKPGGEGKLRVGLITFGDTVNVHSWAGVTLSSDLAAVKASIDGLVAEAALVPGGGNGLPEASDEALREMLRPTLRISPAPYAAETLASSRPPSESHAGRSLY